MSRTCWPKPNCIAKGTTPTLQFHLPFDADIMEWCDIVFSQSGIMVYKKTLADCEWHGNELLLRLTANDTMRFDETEDLAIQLHIGFPTVQTQKTIISSAIMLAEVANLLDRRYKET